jgi:hypothetical protein
MPESIRYSKIIDPSPGAVHTRKDLEENKRPQIGAFTKAGLLMLFYFRQRPACGTRQQRPPHSR